MKTSLTSVPPARSWCQRHPMGRHRKPLVLGRGLYNGSQDDWTNGSVSGVQAYDYALTTNQVTVLYQSIP
ncbi:hypothetical protein QFZ56_000296 [Streptomyces achromogenes]|uniref:Uncharacterized protein n=2 Tax=Streptomyces achromogenes TaxID=67255 RepID=A0ABU0PSH4_STRAH|nr:hypothetical protein [Streptomyces achromogenes]